MTGHVRPSHAAKEIRGPEDVTADHIEDAAAMRAGEYGGQPRTWREVIDALERDSWDDWGNDMDSSAIRYLQRIVRDMLRVS